MEETDSGDTFELYEFDAPSHVVDFKEPPDAEIDKWFEQHSNEADPNLITPSRPPVRQTNGNVSAQSTSASPPSNLVTSWGNPMQKAVPSKRRADNEYPTQPRRVSKRKEVTSGPAAPPSKKQKENPVPQKPRSVQLSSQPSFRRSERLNSKMVQTTNKTSSTTTEPSSSEELEMERIRNLQKEVALHRKRNEASYKAALAGNPPPKKMALTTTIPKDFHFQTDTRIKAPASSNSPQNEVDFIHQLRKPSSPVKARKGATVPKPFNLSGPKRKEEQQPGDYVSVAQQVEQFEKRTPTRYHMRSRRTQERGPSSVKGQHLKLTLPQSPFLMTRKRSRAPTVKSSAEVEAEELEKLHKFKIKALELNKKILEGPEELKKPAVKEPTVPEGFELEIEKRLQERQTTKKSQENEKSVSFKARPLPKKVLEGVVGLPEKKVLYPTVPESPAFALKKRVRMDNKVEEVKQPSPVKAQPVPHFGVPFQPQLPEKHHTEVCPFSFDQREKERQALKEKKLEELRNEEVPQFKAQPLLDFSTVVLPEKKKQDPTKPEPFKLRIDERGAVKLSRWEQMVKEEQKLQEEATIFKAQPNTVINKDPFRPKKESRSAIVVEPFELATERRAREWQEFEQQIAEKEALRARMEEEQRREEEQRVREEIARLRQEQVHKAQPIRHYKPVAVKKNEIPLTIPQSPNFSDRFRL